MNWNTAYKTARAISLALAPACDKCHIAGGVRRGKQDPHDIEIVCIPTPGHPRPEFGQKVVYKSHLERVLGNLEADGWIRPLKGGDKYKQFSVDIESVTGITTLETTKLDLFIVRPETWAVQYTLRTGPSDFSHWIVTPRSKGGALPDGYQVKDGLVVNIESGEAVSLGDEADFLEFLGLENIAPNARTANWTRQ